MMFFFWGSPPASGSEMEEGRDVVLSQFCGKFERFELISICGVLSLIMSFWIRWDQGTRMTKHEATQHICKQSSQVKHWWPQGICSHEGPHWVKLEGQSGAVESLLPTATMAVEEFQTCPMTEYVGGPGDCT